MSNLGQVIPGTRGLDGSTQTGLTFGQGERRRPLRPQDVKADVPVAADVWVIDFCCKGNLHTQFAYLISVYNLNQRPSRNIFK